jgi:hypothetical protein
MVLDEEAVGKALPRLGSGCAGLGWAISMAAARRA